MQIRKNDIIIISEFLNEMKLQGKADSTIKEYLSRLTVFAKFLQSRKIDITEFTIDDLFEFRDELLESKLSNRRINLIFTTIRALLSQSDRTPNLNELSSFSKLKLPVKPKRIKRMSNEQLEQFLSWIDTKQENIRAAFWLLYGSGARVGEVVKLTGADIMMKGGSVYIDITDAKWGSDRCVPITDAKAAEIVWRYKQSQTVNSKPIFNLKKRTLQNYAIQFANNTGIEFRCHLLRHMYASRLLENGVPLNYIQFLLGHKNVSMTLHYTQAATVDLTTIAPKINI